MADVEAGRATEMLEVRALADRLHIHPAHLSNTIKLTTGHSPCHFFEQRILEVAQRLLQNPRLSVAEIAARLTYDPSNFIKFFKHFAGTKLPAATRFKRTSKSERPATSGSGPFL